MRIAVGGLSHETNTYAVMSTGVTGLDRFQQVRGDRLLAMAGTGSGLGGILDGCVARGDKIVPAFFALAEPSGTIAADAYAYLKAELIAALAKAIPVDAVALELHGAGVAEGVDDLEADLGRSIREAVGPSVRIAAVLDLHGNITPAMAAAYDLLLGCHLYPHTDLHERGLEAIDLLHRIVDDGLQPVIHVEQLPMLLPPATTDGDSPAARTNAMCAEIERRDGVVDCTFMHGFPYTDVPDAGSSIIVITDGAADQAIALGAEAASWVWARREDFRSEADTPESAVRRAAAATAGPVVINETSDNPGGGTPGDGTHLLRAMVEAGVTDACFAFISDPEVVDRAVEAGVGATIDVQLGGKHDNLHGAPLPLRATVRCLTDGRFTLRAMLAGWELSLGPSCRLTAGGIDIVVMSKPFQTIDAEVFLLHGIDVTRYRIIGLKSSQHFRAGFRDIAAEIITADSPGLTTNRVETFDHVRAAGRLWPIDPRARYDMPTV